MPTSPDIKRGGFTLIELLVGLAVLILLVAVLAGIFGGVSRTWQTGHANTERMQNVRAITDMMVSELSTALLPLNRTDTNSLQLVMNPSAISQNFLNPNALFWQAPVATDLTLGDVAAIGYFVKWDESNPDQPIPLLCRLAVFADNPNFLVYSQAGGTVPWLTDAILNAEAPADKTNLYDGLVAENVVALFVSCLDSKGRPITSAYDGGAFTGTDNGFDSRQGYTDADGIQSEDYTDSSGTLQPLCVLPQTIQISFVLVDPRFAQRIGPSEKARLVALAASIAGQTPSGNASDFVTAALNDSALKAIGPGLHAHNAEINLLNAR